MPLEFVPLDTAGWTHVESLLKGKSNSSIGRNLIDKWKTAKAKYVIIDNEYIDRDFTEMFASFYSRTFKRHHKLCKRLFVFSFDFMDDIIGLTEPGELVNLLEESSSLALISVVTLRPVPKSPINSIASAPMFESDDLRAAGLVKSKLQKHLIGANVEIAAFEMTQQDS